MMRNAKRFLLAGALAAVAVSAPAVMIEGFNYADDAAAQAEWIVGGDYGTVGGVPSVGASTADKVEGISSLRFQYTYPSNPYYFAQYQKTYATPIDLSAARQIWFNVKAPDNVQADMWFIMNIRNASNQNFRFVCWDGFLTIPGGNTWSTAVFPLDYQGHDGWSPHNPFDNVNLKAVTSISIGAMKNDATAVGGSFTMLIDNLSYETGYYTGESVLDDFNYADTTALKAVWGLIGSSPTIDIATTTVAGMKGMELKVANNAAWTRFGAIKTFDSTINLSTAGGLRVWAYGPFGQTPTFPLYVYLEDDTINRVRAICTSFVASGDWACYNLVIPGSVAPCSRDGNVTFYDEYVDYASGNAVSVFHQDKWDAAEFTACDMTKIKKIQFSTENGNGNESVNFAIGPVSVFPKVAMSAVGDWSIY